ncbi:MAG: outer membrane beta-barrel protein [Salinivirgaceae bacterium]
MKNQKLRITILSLSLWLAFNALSANLARAQSNDFYYGVQAGVGLTASDMLNGDPSYGGYVYTGMNLTKRLFGQIGLTYNRYDAYELIEFPPIEHNDFNYTRLAYIENYLGISAIGGTQFFNKVKLVIKAGPEVSYAVAKKVVEENMSNYDKSERYYARENNFRFGIIAGAGIIVPISNKLSLNLDILNNSAIRTKKDDGEKTYRPNSMKVFAGIQLTI